VHFSTPAGRVARLQQDRQARTQHPGSSGELEPVDPPDITMSLTNRSMLR
jgi:hypothetical protein